MNAVKGSKRRGTISYSTYTPKQENALLNIQAAIIEEIHPERSSIEDLQGNLPTLIIKTCFKWKSKKRSGILRLESSLFSGYELHSVNPVVLDGATFADLHYGSRGESVWFVFANISSTCPVCVTYEARSNFVITSLRPAFAKIYPSTRPDLAVETFFHARPGSPLLRGITDDDFITWFDKTEIASLTSTASIDNICECGRICSRDYEFRKQNESGHAILNLQTNDSHAEIIEIVTVSDIKYSDSTSATPIVTSDIITNMVLSTAISEFNATESGQKVINNISAPSINNVHNGLTEEIKTSLVKNVNVTDNEKIDNNLKPTHTEVIIKKLPKYYPKKEDTKKKVLPRRKGTLKATYGDKQEKFLTKPKLDNETVTSIPQHVTIKILKESNKSSQKFSENNKTLDFHVTFYNTTIEKVNDIKHSLKNELTNNLSQSISNNTIIAHKETTIIPHIAAITKSNIQTMHNKTKKPKIIAQIKKPNVKATSNNTIIAYSNEKNTTVEKISKHINKSPPIEKPVTKSLKSINKEIHKMPPTPISETSKALVDQVKSDIAPENRGGYEVLDKSRLWDLLKEGTESEMSKIEDKLQINNRLNVVTNLTTQNDNRSL